MFQSINIWFFDRGIKILIILLVVWLINRFAQSLIEKAVRKAVKPAKGEKDTKAEKKREDTLIRIVNGVLTILVWIIAIMMILPEFGLDVGPILAGAGILGVALGFGAQYMIRDFLAGLFIVLENQYRVGDVVCLDDVCGGVEDITLRKTVLRNLDGMVYHIPNGSFSKAANLTKGYSRAHMNVSVAYKEDLDKVMEVINKVGKKMAEEDSWREYILKPIQVAGPGPDKFGDSGIEIKVLGETIPLKQWDVLKEFRRRLKIAFDKEGIEIPFPQMSVWQRGVAKKGSKAQKI